MNYSYVFFLTVRGAHDDWENAWHARYGDAGRGLLFAVNERVPIQLFIDALLVRRDVLDVEEAFEYAYWWCDVLGEPASSAIVPDADGGKWIRDNPQSEQREEQEFAWWSGVMNDTVVER